MKSYWGDVFDAAKKLMDANKAHGKEAFDLARNQVDAESPEQFLPVKNETSGNIGS